MFELSTNLSFKDYHQRTQYMKHFVLIILRIISIVNGVPRWTCTISETVRLMFNTSSRADHVLDFFLYTKSCLIQVHF